MHKLSLPFEIKATGDKYLEGHGSVFGNVDLGADIMVPGAFKRSLAEHKSKGTMPAMLWQHQSDQIPGIWVRAGEDDVGLDLKGEFADTQLGREARTLSKMRAVRGLSIGGMIVDFDFDRKGNRLIKEFDLWEVSLVTFPMNPKATIEAIKSMYADPRAFERHLREVGVSKTDARGIVHDVLGDSGVMLDDDPRCDADEDLVALMKQVSEQSVAHQMKRLARA